MPKYAYQCEPCCKVIYAQRKVDDRRVPAICPGCNGLAPFAFTARFNLTTQPEAYRDENKFALGFSESDRRETARADDAAYEVGWAGKDPPKRVTVKDALAKTSLNDLFPQA